MPAEGKAEGSSEADPTVEGQQASKLDDDTAETSERPDRNERWRVSGALEVHLLRWMLARHKRASSNPTKLTRRPPFQSAR